jgi:hypothetical protein
MVHPYNLIDLRNLKQALSQKVLHPFTNTCSNTLLFPCALYYRNAFPHIFLRKIKNAGGISSSKGKIAGIPFVK